MVALPSYFRDFLAEIRLTSSQVQDLKKGHTTLRKRLLEDQDLSPIIVSTFLQGSYRRSTATRPNTDSRSDVDVIVVTNLMRENHTPAEAINLFRPFMKEHYKGCYEVQGRSIGISLSYVDLDVVITSAPSEVDERALKSESIQALDSLEDVESDWRFNDYWPSIETRSLRQLEVQSRMYKSATTPEWKTQPLWIPDRDADCWTETDPISQFKWTRDKNKKTSGLYINVVKSIKWWRRAMQPLPKYPKGYPLEHLCGDCCPDDIRSVGEGLMKTLQGISTQFANDVADGRTPVLWDRGVQQDVMKRVVPEDFASFHQKVSEAAQLAEEAYNEEDVTESARLWRNLLGDKFPPPPGEGQKGEGGGGTGGFSERISQSDVSGTRFA